MSDAVAESVLESSCGRLAIVEEPLVSRKAAERTWSLYEPRLGAERLSA